MHHHHRGAGLDLAVNEAGEYVVVVVLVHAQAALHRHRDVHRLDHGRYALGHQHRLAHQAGAETPRLHAVGRAAAVEVHLVIAPLGGDARGLCQQGRIAATQLQRQRLFAGIETEQALAIAVYHRVGVHHFGVQPRTRRQQAMEHPAMAIGPVHHGGDGQAQGISVTGGGGRHRAVDRGDWHCQ
ncbi:hypothetical protein D3C73_1143810 [compost metagenome]